MINSFRQLNIISSSQQSGFSARLSKQFSQACPSFKKKLFFPSPNCQNVYSVTLALSLRKLYIISKKAKILYTMYSLQRESSSESIQASRLPSFYITKVEKCVKLTESEFESIVAFVVIDFNAKCITLSFFGLTNPTSTLYGTRKYVCVLQKKLMQLVTHQFSLAINHFLSYYDTLTFNKTWHFLYKLSRGFHNTFPLFFSFA